MIDDADVARIVDAVREALGDCSLPELLTADEVAAFLRVDRRTLRRLELQGEIPPSISIGGSKRWRRSSVERWLATVPAKSRILRTRSDGEKACRDRLSA